MSQEDSSLSNRLRLLEIDHKQKLDKKTEPELNPFMRRRSKSLSSINFGSSCDCAKKTTNIKHTTSFKRTSKKILRDPILKFIKCSNRCGNTNKSSLRKDKQFGQCSVNDRQDFKSIIDACEQLNLGSDNNGNFTTLSFLRVRSRSSSDLPQKNDPAILNGRSVGELTTLACNTSSTVGSSCSHQARMNLNPPCDVTIDELASYLETIVHIPKKMSSMAEMMYI